MIAQPTMTSAHSVPRDPAPHVIQGLLRPEPGISTEHLLYMRLSGPAGYSDASGQIVFAAGGRAKFNTAANLFNLGKWRRSCQLEDLGLRLRGAGRFELTIEHLPEGRSSERVVNEIVVLDGDEGLWLDLGGFLATGARGLLHFGLTALGEGHLADASWETRQAPRRQPRLTLSITTFRREAAVEASVARFRSFMEQSPLAPWLHLIVVDNGRSAGIESSDHVTLIENENLGGSGGFARGLIEAEARGATHCLFMDDDASVHMGAIERSWRFLAHATDPRTAIAGGLTKGDFRWTLWESGAVFQRHCQPQWLGTNLRDFGQVSQMELGSIGDKPHNFYGGWWYFAFPVEGLKHRPFPFFVRGDDVSFSIANDFDIVTLPGVLCFQDADFSDKESLQTLYLDLRSHIIHHLALPQMDIGRFNTLTMPGWFFLRSMMQCHYETLEALNLATEDVMRGPDFFARNADMAERRAALAAIRKAEAWVPLDGPLPAQKIRFDPHRWLPRTFMKLTLNGHLLPFFSRYGNRIVLQASERGQIRKTWGAAQITYVSSDGRQSFTVRHSKAAALRQGWRMLRNGLRLARRYEDLKREWRQGYDALTRGDGFWRRRLGLETPKKGPDQAPDRGPQTSPAPAAGALDRPAG